MCIDWLRRLKHFMHKEMLGNLSLHFNLMNYSWFMKSYYDYPTGSYRSAAGHPCYYYTAVILHTVDLV